jgi:hypothetical protein
MNDALQTQQNLDSKQCSWNVQVLLEAKQLFKPLSIIQQATFLGCTGRFIKGGIL